MFTIISFLLVLSVIVFAHEFGHYFVARKIGIIPKEFGFGMPPRIIGWYKDKMGKWKKVRGSKDVDDASDTIWSLNALPLGGFVALGEDDEESDDPNHFINKKIWQKSAVLVAGVSMNIILAAVLISLGFLLGMPQDLENINSRAIVSDPKIQIAQVFPNSPAEKAGLEMGDTILSINNQKFDTYQDLQRYVDEHTGEELEYLIKRNNEELKIKVTPELRADTNKGGVGIAIAETGIVRYPWYLVIFEGIRTTLILTWAIIVAFYEMVKGLILGHGMSAEVAGPVGIATLTGQVARMGFVYLLQFTALLSINLAIINILPFPALDGGRLLFLLIEKIKGSPVSRKVEGAIHYAGFGILMLLIILVTYQDIVKLIDFKALFNKIF